MWRGEDRRHDGREREGRRGREGPFILSDKESWIGVYHTFNWTSSLCLAGRWKWTTGMCQLAPRPSTSPVHSCYQPPTISISLSLSHPLSLVHTLQAWFCLHFLSPPPLPSTPSPSLSLCSLICIPDILLSFHLSLLSISTSYFVSPPNISLHISLSSALPAFPCVFFLSIIAYERIPCILVCFCGSLAVALLLLACHSRHHIDL